MHYIIGLDDTDNLESRGTGHLARFIATTLAQDFQVRGVTRHQLLEGDDRVPKTANNSCAAILVDADSCPITEMAERVRKIMLDDFQIGSDPGLCVAQIVPPEVMAFGKRAQTQFLYQKEARQLASAQNLYLEGLGGDQDGVIGALAAVGLAATGSDGRYVLVGSMRDLQGLQPVSAILAAGITAVHTTEGKLLTEGMVLTDKMRPARREGQPVLIVQREDHYWVPLKLN